MEVTVLGRVDSNQTIIIHQPSVQQQNNNVQRMPWAWPLAKPSENDFLLVDTLIGSCVGTDEMLATAQLCYRELPVTQNIFIQIFYCHKLQNVDNTCNILPSRESDSAILEGAMTSVPSSPLSMKMPICRSISRIRSPWPGIILSLSRTFLTLSMDARPSMKTTRSRPLFQDVTVPVTVCSSHDGSFTI